MKRLFALCIAAGAITAIVTAALAHGPGRGMARHNYVMQNGIPEPFRGAASPLETTAAAIGAGIAIYAEQCGSCHGPNGRGDGEAGKELDPPPSNLVDMLAMPMMKDDFFLWTIMECGERLKTDMPTFKEVLTPTEVWQVIAYMRAGFPAMK